MRVISIANFKGGTGKTVTACTLAALLADKSRRVLLIDADPQGNASDFYGADRNADTLLNVLTGDTRSAEWMDILSPSGREGLSLLPSDIGLLTLDLASMRSGTGDDAVGRLWDLLDTLRGDNAFDYVLIDCPPSFTAASVAALSISDEVIIPTRVDLFSHAGVGELIRQIQSLMLVRSTLLRWRILITMADATNLYRQGAEYLRASFPADAVYKTAIRNTVKVGEATYARQPVTDYAPHCTAAMDYRDLLKEVLADG